MRRTMEEEEEEMITPIKPEVHEIGIYSHGCEIITFNEDKTFSLQNKRTKPEGRNEIEVDIDYEAQGTWEFNGKTITLNGKVKGHENYVLEDEMGEERITKDVTSDNYKDEFDFTKLKLVESKSKTTFESFVKVKEEKFESLF